MQKYDRINSYIFIRVVPKYEAFFSRRLSLNSLKLLDGSQLQTALNILFSSLAMS